ncbi:MAG: phosphatidate cytidylyltransferase [Elusimicrobiota bacterium]
MLLPRFLTGLIGIPIVLLVIWLGNLPFAFAIYTVTLLCLWEFYALWQDVGFSPGKVFGLIFGSVMYVLIYTESAVIGKVYEKAVVSGKFTAAAGRILNDPLPIDAVMLIFFLGVAVYLIWKLFRQPKETTYIDIMITFWGVIYVVWLLSHLVMLRELRPLGQQYTFMLFLTIWIGDTAAYAAGVTFGKIYAFPRVSPHKTLEGGIAGVLASIIVVWLFNIFIIRGLSIVNIISIALIISVAGFFGDLTESFFKRQVGVKDSSALLPGHGGMLDRFDSLMFAGPLLYYYLKLFL